MEVIEQLNAYLQEIEQTTLETSDALEAFRIRFLGSKNIIKPLQGEVKTIATPDGKKAFGQLLNQIKQSAESKFAARQSELENAASMQLERLDLTAPGEPMELGARHPLSVVMNRMIGIFQRLGFVVAEDREIETDWFNFTALGTPPDHPARDMQDTFYIKEAAERLLRTHTSSVQARVMSAQKPPIRIIAPGRVYRNETISARSHCQFHQIEGLYVAENVSFADLRQTIYYFAHELFGSTKIRMRPSYFPFTEPSAEVDVYWGLKTEADHRITKGTGWLEILGCGMVDPVLLENCGIDSERYTGFAFGIGIERTTMLLYQIEDIRLFFENDLRFLRQFKAIGF